jgi:hypothetical protein
VNISPLLKVSLTVLSLIFSASLPANSQAQTQPIYPTTESSTGPATDGLATGDFNNDGQADIAFINSGPATNSSPEPFIQITVLLNQGASEAAIPVKTTSVDCTDAFSLVAADLNNDKNLDLAFVCPTAGYVVVLLGNGDGTFQKPAYYALSGAESLAPAVDLNGDGFLDLAVTASSACTSATVNVLLNHGSASPGAFLNPVPYAISQPSCIGAIRTGDFNGDGKQDLIVQNSLSQLEVFYGNGDGTLRAPQSTSVGGIFATGNFNSDGFTDIATVILDPQNINPPSLQVLLGSSSGQFSNGGNLTLQPQSNYSALVPAGTTNGGSNVNLALIGDNTTILLGNGNGGFTLGRSYAGAASGTAVPEPDSTGNTNLIFAGPGAIFTVTGNGDGTLNAPPAYWVGQNPTSLATFATADVNGDGLTDIVYVDSKGALDTALSRGDGTFTLAGEVPAIKGEVFTPGDFNGDGKTDVAALINGAFIDQDLVTQDAEVFLYKGNGDGTFQPATAPVDIPVVGAYQAVAGDFNGDGHLDLVVAYSNSDPHQEIGSGIVFLPGNGDGTFGAPVTLSQSSISVSASSQLFTADLNNDGKLDLIWNGALYLGNGDGTFKQIPLGIDGSPSAIADLNGDGIPDLVIGGSIYAGNGDGTFQSTPFYTAGSPLSVSVPGVIVAMGDVNGDANPDLLQQYFFNGIYYLADATGDGKGDFVLGNNIYPLGNPPSAGNNSFASLGRLNDQASLLPNDLALDFIVFTDSSATALLNQLNPAPVTLPAPPAPAPPPALFSFTFLTDSGGPESGGRAVAGQQVSFQTGVSGVNHPTGTVTFVAGNTTLGTATIANGGASLATAFSAPGVYQVTANYSGDAHNLPSTSNTVSITILAVQTALTASSTSANENQQVTFTATVSVTGVPDPSGTVSFIASENSVLLGTASLVNGIATLPVSFTAPGVYDVIAQYSFGTNAPTDTSNPVTVTVTPAFAVSATPTSATIQPGQNATFPITVTPANGFTGTVTLSCGALPSEVTCNFSAPSLSLTGGMPATSTLTLSTMAPSSAALRPSSTSLPFLAWGGILCFAFSTRRIQRKLTRAGMLLVLLAAGIFAVSGCGSANQSQAPTNPGTPAGTQTVSVVVADSTGAISQSLTLQVTVQ